MPLLYDGRLIPRSRAMRRNMTPQESKLWYQCLRNYPIRFQRQRVIDEFIVDFFCAKALLVIEVDGNQHGSKKGIVYDTDRTKVLERQYIQVLRITNDEVESDFFTVCRKIDNAVKKRMIEMNKYSEHR